MPATQLLREPGLDPLSEMEVPCPLSEIRGPAGVPWSSSEDAGGGNCSRWSAQSRSLWWEPLMFSLGLSVCGCLAGDLRAPAG